MMEERKDGWGVERTEAGPNYVGPLVLSLEADALDSLREGTYQVPSLGGDWNN